MNIYWGDNDSFSKNNKCVIGLERDGVINECNGWIRDPKDFKSIPKSLEAITKLKQKGFSVVILSNQGGIEKGLLTIDDVEAVNSYMLSLLGQYGCPSIDALYYSASDKKNDYYAKPNIGMFKRCETEHPYISFKNSFYVGTKLEDIKAALKIGSRPIIIKNAQGQKTINNLKRGLNKNLLQKIYTFDSLYDFVNALN